MSQAELCQLLHQAMMEAGGSHHTTNMWNDMGHTPISWMIPSYRCYFAYLIFKIEEQIQVRCLCNSIRAYYALYVIKVTFWKVFRKVR